MYLIQAHSGSLSNTEFHGIYHCNVVDVLFHSSANWLEPFFSQLQLHFGFVNAFNERIINRHP